MNFFSFPNSNSLHFTFNSQFFYKLKHMVHISNPSFISNDFHDTICMNHNQFSDFRSVYTFIQVVHTEFVHSKSFSYIVFSLQEFKQNASCNNSDCCTNFPVKKCQGKRDKKEKLL